MFGLFKRNKPDTEQRASGMGYTAEIMAARESWLAGASGVGELTGTVQSCISLWEGGFALADVEGTDLLDRRTLAICARSLALRGEAVFLIRDRLLPVNDWDISTRDGIPKAYRLQISEAGGGTAKTALAGEVLHVRIGSDAVTPWTGTAPLRRSALSAGLLEEIETALRDVYRESPLGSQIVPMPDSTSADMEEMRKSFRGRRGATLVIEGVAQATAAGMNPQLGQRRETLSPDLERAMPIKSLTAARDAILMAYGVLPGVMNRATTGPLVREAQRHLAQWTLQPIAMTLAEEASEKLGGRVMIDMLRPVQGYDVGGRARSLSAIVGALTQAKDAGLSGDELNKALTLVNWGEGDNAA